jgi:hypothetical protein
MSRKRYFQSAVALTLAAGVGLLFARLGRAEPSCTDWMKQKNGCDQRVCVSDQGKTYCEEQCPGDKAPHTVPCR